MANSPFGLCDYMRAVEGREAFVVTSFGLYDNIRTGWTRCTEPKGGQEMFFSRSTEPQVGMERGIRVQWVTTRADFFVVILYRFFLLTPQTCMRSDFERDLRLGYVHLNRPSSTSHCPLKTLVRTHFYYTW